jgi:ABC-type nitrate/sulfonate/bicarbonate transport system substrate-binding protein
MSCIYVMVYSSLDRQGVRYNLIESKNFGARLKGPVYFTARRLVEKQPGLVEAFLRTMVDGWRFALTNPERSIQLLHV